MAALTRNACWRWFSLKVENANKIKLWATASSPFSTKFKTMEGPTSKGQWIFHSPYGDTTIPEMTIPEYVWKNLNRYPNHTALECGVTGRKYSYAQTRDASNYVARSLLSMGLKKGDVVAIVLPNMPEFPVSFLGILEANLVVTTTNPHYTANEISHQLISSNAKAVITCSEIANTVMTAAKSAPHLQGKFPFIVVDDGTGPAPEGAIPFQDLVTRGKTLPPLPSNGKADVNDLAALPFSSGTTGLPKGVMLSHRNLVGNIVMVDEAIGRHILHETTETYQEIEPAVLPFFHIFGMKEVMLTSLSNGERLITLPKFVPKDYISILRSHKPTVLLLVPPILMFMSNASSAIKREYLERVHTVFSGAAPLSETDVNAFYNTYQLDKNFLKFYQGYGLTETSPVVFIECSAKKFSSIGKPICNSDVRLVDPITNKDVNTPRQTGELWVHGPHIMKGYWNNEKATRETITEDGWMKTGDIAYFDEDLDFYISDRLKELIKVKGFQVAPAELEALLRTHPLIEEAAVIGVPDERAGELPKAFVVLRKGEQLGEEEVQKFVQGKVAEFKELKGGVTFVDDIPKNASGKILRSHLKRDYLNKQ